jgi:AcrR family transcriptional regulator
MTTTTGASTADRVRRAAVDLFAARGFHGTGIRDLAEAAGLSSATLYHYMGTKEDLLAAIMRDSLERLITAAERVVATTGDPVTRLTALVSMHVREHAERQAETVVVDGEMRALTGERRAAVVALRDAYERIWQDVIDAGCAAGAFGVAEPRVARLGLLELCSGVSRWYSPGGPLPLAELTDRYTEMALGLLGAGR